MPSLARPMAEQPKDYTRDPIVQAGVGTPDIQSRVRFDGVARNTDKVKVAIVIPSVASIPVYGELVCEVKVFSKVKPGYHFRGIFPLSGMSARNARQYAGIVGGAMTERLMAVDKSVVSEIDYANEAMNAFDNALARYEAQQATPLKGDDTLDKLKDAIALLEMQGIRITT